MAGNPHLVAYIATTAGIDLASASLAHIASSFVYPGGGGMIKMQSLAGEAWFNAAGAAADPAPHTGTAYFLDFETIGFGVPIWKDTRPYQQLPFQFSLHIVSSSGEMMHKEFLDLSGENPSEDFADQHGSRSIQAVLSTVCPDLSSDSLDGVQHGQAAQGAFLEAIRRPPPFPVLRGGRPG